MLPHFVDREDAIQFYQEEPCTDAIKAYIVGYLAKQGMSNRMIRAKLGIDKVYTVTHLKKAGTQLTPEQLALWDRNPKRITLAHIRALSVFKKEAREDMMRNLLVRNTTAHQLRRLAKGEGAVKSADMKKYGTLMSEVIGRPVSVDYDATKQSGALTVKFFSLDELDDLSKQLGFASEDHF